MAGAATETLRRVPLLADLDATELASIAEAMGERTFRAGEAVSVQGAPGDSFYVVESGEGEVTVDGESRGKLGPGDFFGEIALLMGSERTATIEATTDLHCYVLTSADFRTIVEANPTLAWKLVESMMSRLS